MFWDRVAWVYDIFADVINRKANQTLCMTVEQWIRPPRGGIGMRLRDGPAQRCTCRAVQTFDRDGFFPEYAPTRKKEVRKIWQYHI